MWGCEEMLGEVWKSVLGMEKCRKSCGKVWEKV